MSSINTNASAMTALQTLQQTNKALAETQSRISTGFRVATASDNAAYWSIATTMRSDNKAMSTVQDALGLGAATVDVAYTAMDAVKDTLDDIKTKLVAAKQPDVDKSKIQGEIDQLQQQLKTYASSASFSGTNWLSIDSGSGDYSATASVVSSFSRDAGGNLSIGTVDINVGDIALFDDSGDGLLEGGTSATLSSAAFAYTAGDMNDGGSVTISVNVDGQATDQEVKITIANASAGITLDDVVTALNGSLDGATASKSEDGKLVLTSDTTGTDSSVEITGVVAALADDSSSSATFGIVAVDEATGAATGGGIMDIDITEDGANLDTFIDMVDAMADKVTSAAADLGSVKSRISSQQDFIKSLMDAVDRGIGQLVDADMNEESTRLQALQTQQQLGIQALSIANSSSQSILSLFR